MPRRGLIGVAVVLLLPTGASAQQTGDSAEQAPPPPVSEAPSPLPPAPTLPSLPQVPPVPDSGVDSEAPADAEACPGAHAPVQRSARAMRQARNAVVCLLNRVRIAHGLPALRESPRLRSAARRHSNAMVSRRFFAHVEPGGVTLGHRLRTARYGAGRRRWAAGENIGFGSHRYSPPAVMVRWWMRSASHRANVLERDFREVGVGVAPGIPRRPRGRGATYTVDLGVRR